MVAGAHHLLPCLNKYLCPPKYPSVSDGQGLLFQSLLHHWDTCSSASLVVPQQHVVQSASQLQVDWLTQEKCNVVWSALGCVVMQSNCRRVAGMVAVCEKGYLMHEIFCYHGPHIGNQFLSQACSFQFPFLWKPSSYTGPA